jgi:carboxynorspermidine decarboxylase
MIDYNAIPSPCYVIEEDKFRKNLSLIKHVSEASGAEFILAFKGFAMWKAFPIVREYIKGATASSLNEAKLAFEEMQCKPHVYAPVYLENEMPEMVGLASHITFNSLSQFHKFYPDIQKSNKNISMGLRVNPGYSPVTTALYNPASPGSRLGETSGNIGKKLPEGIEGLHFHVLCENTSNHLELALEAFEDQYAKYFKQLKWVNFGGGHLVTHTEYDVDHLIQLLRSFIKKHKLHVILEPGSAFAWETGVLVSTVQDIVEHGGVKTAMVDVSFTAHMPDCLEMPYKPRIVGAIDAFEGKPAYRIGGMSCLAGDYMGNWSFEKELKPGDKIVFQDMIHYTMVKTSTFNGVAHPSIGLWKSNGSFQLFKQFGYDDYKGRLS